MVVAHKCDNTRCCQIEHLFLTTQTGNIADRTSKNRQHKKIKDDVMAEIKAERAAGHSGYSIAKKFGIQRSYLYRVFSGEYRA
jgi:hypothetical protein